jgi:AhpD family alkylhydroperoxidase
MATLRLLTDNELSPEARAVFDDIRAVRQTEFVNNFWRALAHGCNYCIHSHTAAARAKGMTEAEYAELLAIVGMASETNRLVTGLGVEVDDAFKL